MTRPVKKQFGLSQFHFIHRGELQVFRNYPSLQAYRYQVTPWILKPLRIYKDDKERKVEEKLEVKYQLPNEYLAGLVFKTATVEDRKQLASSLAHTYHQNAMKQAIKATVDKYLPEAMSQYHFLERFQLSLTPTEVNMEPIYQIMENRYALSPVSTYQVPHSPPEPCGSLAASAPPLPEVSDGEVCDPDSLQNKNDVR